jgi:hypothetical protein
MHFGELLHQMGYSLWVNRAELPYFQLLTFQRDGAGLLKVVEAGCFQQLQNYLQWLFRPVDALMLSLRPFRIIGLIRCGLAFGSARLTVSKCGCSERIQVD